MNMRALIKSFVVVLIFCGCSAASSFVKTPPEEIVGLAGPLSPDCVELGHVSGSLPPNYWRDRVSRMSIRGRAHLEQIQKEASKKGANSVISCSWYHGIAFKCPKEFLEKFCQDVGGFGCTKKELSD